MDRFSAVVSFFLRTAFFSLNNGINSDTFYNLEYISVDFPIYSIFYIQNEIKLQKIYIFLSSVSFTIFNLTVFRSLRMFLSFISNSFTHYCAFAEHVILCPYLSLFIHFIHLFYWLRRIVVRLWNDDGFNSHAIYGAVYWIKSK